MSNEPIIKTDNVLVRVMALGVDSSTDWHYHSRVGDFFVGLSGVVKLETKSPDDAIILFPGQRAQVKPQQVHRVSNIHKERVLVPSAVFKAIYDPNRQEAGAYVVGNTPGALPQVASIAELNKLAGLDIFPSVSTQTKSRTMRLPIPKPRKKRNN